MKKVNLLLFVLSVSLLLSCSRKQYEISSIDVSFVQMDSTWDAKVNPQIQALVDTYKENLEKEMNVQIGTATETLIKGTPQSLLSNLTADVLKERAEKIEKQVDFAVVNNGGIRTTLNQGIITVGNLYEIYPFENALVILDMPGKAVKEFFDFIAKKGGEGLSTGIQLIIKDGKVESLEIGNQPLDENRLYKVATVDYLAEGNDGMVAFKQASHVLSSNEMLRDIMIDYVKECTKNNKEINAKLDNRIIIDP